MLNHFIKLASNRGYRKISRGIEMYCTNKTRFSHNLKKQTINITQRLRSSIIIQFRTHDPCNNFQGDFGIKIQIYLHIQIKRLDSQVNIACLSTYSSAW